MIFELQGIEFRALCISDAGHLEWDAYDSTNEFFPCLAVVTALPEGPDIKMNPGTTADDARRVFMAVEAARKDLEMDPDLWIEESFAQTHPAD